MVFSVRGKVAVIGDCGRWKAGLGVFRSPRILAETANPLQSVTVRITAPGLNETPIREPRKLRFDRLGANAALI
jgi:hypothetical protein